MQVYTSPPKKKNKNKGQETRPLCHLARSLPCARAGLVVKMRVTSAWQNSLKGLCGTHDGNSMNELMMRDGSIAASPTEFGNSWQEAGVTCSDIPEAEVPPDPCTVGLGSLNRKSRNKGSGVHSVR